MYERKNKVEHEYGVFILCQPNQQKQYWQTCTTIQKRLFLSALNTHEKVWADTFQFKRIERISLFRFSPATPTISLLDFIYILFKSKTVTMVAEVV